MDVNKLVNALDEIKSITKRVPASSWTPEFREIANIVHRTLRDHVNVDALRCSLCGTLVAGDMPVVCRSCFDRIAR